MSNLTNVLTSQFEGRTNISTAERVCSVLTGSILAGCGVVRQGAVGWTSAAAGGALMWRGLTGWCQLYEALGMNTAEHSPQTSLGAGEGIRLEGNIVVQRSPEEVFQFWRKLSNLPTVFSHLKSVEERNFKQSHWVANGPLGFNIEWDAEIIAARFGELISWRSLEGSAIATAGSVRFEPAGRDATDVHVLLRYSPPAGRLGATVAQWLGEVPDEQLEADLQAFKKTLEAQDATQRITAPRDFSSDSSAPRAREIRPSNDGQSQRREWHVGDAVWDASGTRQGKVIGIERPTVGTVDRSEGAQVRYSVQWADTQRGEMHVRADDLRAEAMRS